MPGLMRDVRIKPVLNGFRVTVGCQELVFYTIEELTTELVAYHKDPDGREKIYREHAVNPTLDPQPTLTSGVWGWGKEIFKVTNTDHTSTLANTLDQGNTI